MASQIVQIDLCKPLPAVAIDRRYSAVWMLVRFGPQPLGWLRCLTRDYGTNIPSQRLGELIADQLWTQLRDAGKLAPDALYPPQATSSELPLISVVVCTRDRADKLDRQLRSIGRLDYPKFEAIVIDNAPRTSATQRLCERFPIARYVVEPRRGLNYARNTGWQLAQGDIVAYTHDDACVDPNWLTALSQNYIDPSVHCVTGVTFPLELATASQELFERAGGLSRGFDRRICKPGTWNAFFPLDAGRYGTGANLSLRRSTLQQLKGFDVALDEGSLARTAGDLDIMARVLRDANGSIVYEPRAICWHQHVRTSGELRRHAYDTGYGFAAYAMKHANDLEVGNLALQMLRQRLSENLHQALRTRNPQTLSLLLLELAGGLLGWRAYRRSLRKVASDQRRFKLKGTGPFILPQLKGPVPFNSALQSGVSA